MQANEWAIQFVVHLRGTPQVPNDFFLTKGTLREVKHSVRHAARSRYARNPVGIVVTLRTLGKRTWMYWNAPGNRFGAQRQHLQTLRLR
jgi:hypothetical protein